MGISQALYTGVTGLTVNADSMGVIANNIANANAKGFKRDRAEFEDLLSISLSSGSSSAQLGRGSRLRDVKTVHTQGGLAVMDNLTDLAIQGQGFFVLSQPNQDVNESAGRFYTRVGSFQFNKDGFLSDSSGAIVQGYSADTYGNLTTKLGHVRIDTTNIPPQPTKHLVLNVNLDSRLSVNPAEFDIKDPEKTSNFNNTVSIFDSHGRAHQCTVYYKRVEDSEGLSWQWFATVDNKEVVDPDDGAAQKMIGSGTVKFDNLGHLLEETTNESVVNFSDGALPGQTIDFDFGKNIQTEKGTGLAASTSIAAKSVTLFSSQDGYESGNMKSLKMEQDGTIFGIYTNGIQRRIAALSIASFQNQDSLRKSGRNYFTETIESGPPLIGQPTTGTRGALYASSLEESNVDLANEFVQMIVTQRAFQANSRSVTTTDSMIEEVVNLKR